MKKIIYMLLFVFLSATAITSCNEEDVRPNIQVDAPGGSGSTGKI